MASSVALASAPPEIFVTLDETRERVWDPCRPAEGTHNPIARTTTTTTTTSSSKLAAPPSWRAEGLSLQGLYGLACSLNPSDEELAPVQAWFEMAALYPTELLLREDVLTRLREAFRGTVRCPHFGAAINRDVFESIVARILGPEMEAWEVAAGLGGLGASAVIGAGTWTDATVDMETDVGMVGGGG